MTKHLFYLWPKMFEVKPPYNVCFTLYDECIETLGLFKLHTS